MLLLVSLNRNRLIVIYGKEEGFSKDVPPYFRSEGPQHQVKITKPFYMSVTEVTQKDYIALMQLNPSEFSERGKRSEAVKGLDTSLHPVELVSWENAIEFCNRLSENEGLRSSYVQDNSEVTVIDGTGYRLPTEAEWEYSCRAGTESRWSFGDDEEELSKYGWTKSNSEKRTHVVGKLLPNQFGLFDMHGNVWEWCQDHYSEDFYKKNEEAGAIDPIGLVSASECGIRGGSIVSTAETCRSAFCGHWPTDPVRRGIRLVMSVSAASKGK